MRVVIFPLVLVVCVSVLMVPDSGLFIDSLFVPHVVVVIPFFHLLWVGLLVFFLTLQELLLVCVIVLPFSLIDVLLVFLVICLLTDFAPVLGLVVVCEGLLLSAFAALDCEIVEIQILFTCLFFT